MAGENLALPWRRFLTMSAGVGLALAVPMPAFAEDADRTLTLRHLATGKTVKATYWSGGNPVSEGLAEISGLLRDFITDEVGTIDVGLLDFLHGLNHKMGLGQGFEVVKGYVSPDLVEGSDPMTPMGMHARGKAIDLRSPEVDLEHLVAEAFDFIWGGVGTYQPSGYVHIDSGPARNYGEIEDESFCTA